MVDAYMRSVFADYEVDGDGRTLDMILVIVGLILVADDGSIIGAMFTCLAR